MATPCRDGSVADELGTGEVEATMKNYTRIKSGGQRHKLYDLNPTLLIQPSRRLTCQVTGSVVI